MSQSTATVSLPLDTYPMNGSLPRSPTLEAQKGSAPATQIRRWVKAIFGDDNTIDDPVERQFETAIKIAKGEERKFLRSLSSDYRHLRRRKCGALFLELFQCFTITDEMVNGQLKRQVDTLLVDEDTTVSTFISGLYQTLSCACPEGLRILALAVKTGGSRENEFFSARHKTISTFRRRRLSLPVVPNNIIIFLITKHLNITWPRMQFSSDPVQGDIKRQLLRPPSSRLQCGNLDPAQLEDNYIVLKWQLKAPVFTFDTDVYIWEHHKSLPTFQRAIIRLFPQTVDREMTLLILFQYGNSLRQFLTFHDSARLQGSAPITASQVWSPVAEAVISMCAIFQIIINDTTIFLQECSVELDKMNLAIRQHPSADKVRFLVHLEDCRASAYAGVRHGSRVLGNIGKWLERQQISERLWDAGTSFPNRLKALKRDFEYFEHELSIMEKVIKELKETAHEHLDLTNSRRNFILTIVAAIYLPLSFTTSVFGMNMSTTTPEGPQGFSNWTASWIQNSPIDLQNSTRALASTIGSTGTQSYDWKTFGITAGCLMITLPLSLVIGGVLRWVYRCTFYYATYWRVAAILPAFGFILCSIFEELTVGYGFWTCNGIMIIFLYAKVYQAWGRKRRLSFWSSMSVLTSLCFMLTFFVPPGLSIMSIPWAFFVITWLIPWLRRWRAERVRSELSSTR